MTKTLIESRFKPRYRIKSQTQIPKDTISTNIPSNIQNFGNKILTSRRFVEYSWHFYIYQMSSEDL